MSHLAVRLFGFNTDFDSNLVTFDMFCKDFIPETILDDPADGFTFWDWFHSLILLIGSKKMKNYWDEGYTNFSQLS